MSNPGDCQFTVEERRRYYEGALSRTDRKGLDPSRVTSVERCWFGKGHLGYYWEPPFGARLDLDTGSMRYSRGVPRCGHGLPIRVHCSNQPDSKGRYFLRCNHGHGGKDCGYYYWADESTEHLRTDI